MHYDAVHLRTVALPLVSCHTSPTHSLESFETDNEYEPCSLLRYLGFDRLMAMLCGSDIQAKRRHGGRPEAIEHSSIIHG